MPIQEISLLGLRTALPSIPTRTRHDARSPTTGEIWRRCGAIAIAVSLLPGCVTNKANPGLPVWGFLAADDPAAAEVGRDILAEGGRAADAAAAMALMMAVTLPSRVGLAGGGACIVFDATAKEAKTLDFLPRQTAGGGAMPGYLRGVYALHGAYGRLRWEQVVVRAEQAASRGATLGRVFAADLATWGGRLDAEAQRALLPAGTPPREGAALLRPELGAMLSQVRRAGVTPVYGSGGAVTFAAANGVDPAALAAFQPRWGGTVSIERGNYTLHFADLPGPGGGKALAAAWAAAADAPAGRRSEIALKALGAGAAAGEAPAAGFSVVDSQENAVSCVFTLGAPFGSGRAIPGTGSPAAVPVSGSGFGAPAVFANGIVGRTLFAGTGTASGNDGGNAGPAALLAAALPAIEDGQPAGAIHAARTDSIPGRASLVTCQLDTRTLTKACQAAGDPRAPGLGYAVEQPPGG